MSTRRQPAGAPSAQGGQFAPVARPITDAQLEPPTGLTKSEAVVLRVIAARERTRVKELEAAADDAENCGYFVDYDNFKDDRNADRSADLDELIPMLDRLHPGHARQLTDARAAALEALGTDETNPRYSEHRSDFLEDEALRLERALQLLG